MKIALITVGKTKESYYINAMKEYQKRLTRYTKFEVLELPNIKNSKSLSNKEIKIKEGKLIFSHLKKTDYIILLDEKGVSLTSTNFAKKLEKYMLYSKPRLVFIIGGSYGFSKKIYDISDKILSLSNMTFSHQMVRIIFLEQVYRAYTILNNEPYHNS